MIENENGIVYTLDSSISDLDFSFTMWGKCACSIWNMLVTKEWNNHNTV